MPHFPVVNGELKGQTVYIPKEYTSLDAFSITRNELLSVPVEATFNDDTVHTPQMEMDNIFHFKFERSSKRVIDWATGRPKYLDGPIVLVQLHI